MEFESLLPWMIFGACTFFVWAVFNLVNSRSNRADERLEEMKNPGRKTGDRGPQSGMGKMLEKAAPTLSRALQPKTETEQSELAIRLANAGFSSPAAPSIFLSIKIASLVGGLVFGAGIGYALFGFQQNGFMTLGMVGGFFFYLPEVVVWVIKRGRQERIFLTLPDALDLLVVCVEAGLGLDAGMRRVSEELGDAAPDLCKELQHCNFQLQVGRPRREVLHDLGVRTGVDDLKSMAAILIQAEKFGSSIAQALRVLSDGMRVKRKQMAEERAQQSAVKMIFPLVLFIFPGIFVVLVGPAAISMINQLLSN
ncbi:MAG: type II secretion system F family protein [Planctomycetales bacterium]